MTDVLLVQTTDNGNICTDFNGIVLTNTLRTAVYLALFGGNEDGSNWWGNIGELDPAAVYISRTQTLLRSIQAIPRNIVPVTDAVNADLKDLLDGGHADNIAVEVTLPGVNKLKITIEIDGEEIVFEVVQ